MISGLPSPSSEPDKAILKPLGLMGYRPYNMTNNLFAKAVGNILFVCNTDTLTLSELYSEAGCKVKLWKTVDINDEGDILSQIKNFEAYEAKYDFVRGVNIKDFSFLTVQEQLGFIL